MSANTEAGGRGDERGFVARWSAGRSRTELALRGTITALAVALSVYTFYYAYSLVFVRVRHSNVFLGAGLALFSSTRR